MLYKYYIGANNKTKKVEESKAIGIVSKFFKGFTVAKTVGYWQGEKENSIIIEVETEELEKVMLAGQQLCWQLNQQSVGIAQIGKMEFVNSRL